MCGGSSERTCAQVRALADAAPRQAGPIPFVMRFRVSRVTGLDGRVNPDAACVGYFRPALQRAEDGCHRAVISCNHWRVLGTDLVTGLIGIARSGARCAVPSHLDLASGTLHLQATTLLGSYTIDASVAR